MEPLVVPNGSVDSAVAETLVTQFQGQLVLSVASVIPATHPKLAWTDCRSDRRIHSTDHS